MDSTLLTARTAVIAVSLAVLWTLESLIPIVQGRAHRIRHLSGNFVLGAANTLMVSVVFSSLLVGLMEASRQRGTGLLHHVPLSAVPIAVCAFILIDGWQYIWHVLSHQIPFLWRFHSVHHSDAEMDVTTAVRFHFGEIGLSHVARLAVFPLLGVTGVHLLIYEMVMFPVILFHHSNVALPARYDRILRWFIVTPGMHWVHHSDRVSETNSNYASVFSFWDRAARTYNVRRLPHEIRLGLDYLVDEDWKTLPAALKLPFRRRGERGTAVSD